jgi:hypothetical protein
MALRQVSWLGPTTAIGDAAFSRSPAQWRTMRRFKGLTVAVTTRDSHPLPYSLAAHLRSGDLSRHYEDKRQAPESVDKEPVCRENEEES